MTGSSDVTIAEAASTEDLEAARALIREYQVSLGIDLEFQQFSEELAGLGEMYGPPRGVLLVARLDGVPVGCVGVRPLDPPACEMKRLYVAPAGRGRGLGRELAVRAMAAARARGYATMRLDTLPAMHAAQALYATLGFRDVPAYCDNPVEGTRFLEAVL